MKKLLYTIPVLLILALPRASHASVVVFNISPGVVSSAATTQSGDYGFSVCVGSPSTNFSVVTGNWHWLISAGNLSSPGTWNLFQYSGPDCSGTNEGGAMAVAETISTPNADNTGAGSGNITVSTAKSYLLQFYEGTGAPNSFQLKGGGAPTYGTGWTSGISLVSNWQPQFCVTDDGSACPVLPPPPTGLSLNFIYPNDGSTSPPFSPWIFSVGGITSTSQYYITVHYQQTNHIAVASQLVGVSFNTQSLFGGTNIYYAPFFADDSDTFTGSSGTIPVARRNRDLYNWVGNIPANDDEWQAKAYLYDVSGSQGVVVTSSTINFDMLRYGAVYDGITGAVGTTTYYNPIITASGTIQIVTSTSNYHGSMPSSNPTSTNPGCTPGGGFTDIGGGLAYAGCAVTQLLFTPDDAYTSDIQQSFQKITGVFPFNFVYGTIGQISVAAASAQNSTSSLSLPIFGAHITILSSSSLEDFVGTDNKKLIFQTEDGVAWVGVAWTAMKVIF